jgi:hypothetical protein
VGRRVAPAEVVDEAPDRGGLSMRGVCGHLTSPPA